MFLSEQFNFYFSIQWATGLIKLLENAFTWSSAYKRPTSQRFVLIVLRFHLISEADQLKN